MPETQRNQKWGTELKAYLIGKTDSIVNYPSIQMLKIYYEEQYL